MSAWLGRPNLIDQKNLAFKLPNLRLDQSTANPNLLSPFAHMALQAQLGRRIATVVGDGPSKTGLSAQQVLAVESECENFIDELPPIFRVESPDTSLDEQHPHFVFQRHQMHCVIFVTMLDFLKPYLTREHHEKHGDQDEQLRNMGVGIALRLIKVARNLFDYDFPINAKFHMVAFSVFDTATLMCSAIIHDRANVLPHREEVMDLIESSLDILYQLSLTTKLGASSYKFLFKLVQATPELSRYSPIVKRKRLASISVPAPASPDAKVSLSPGTALSEKVESLPTAAADTLPSMAAPDDLSFDLEQFLAQNPFGSLGDPSALDMGGMEQIWDWEDLHLD